MAGVPREGWSGYREKANCEEKRVAWCDREPRYTPSFAQQRQQGPQSEAEIPFELHVNRLQADSSARLLASLEDT